MVFHLHRVEIVEKEIGYTLNNDGVEAIEERFLRVDSGLSLKVIGREQVVSNENVLGENSLKLVLVGIHDPKLLEGL
jgi:hypothetical protein